MHADHNLMQCQQFRYWRCNCSLQVTNGFPGFQCNNQDFRAPLLVVHEGILDYTSVHRSQSDTDNVGRSVKRARERNTHVTKQWVAHVTKQWVAHVTKQLKYRCAVWITITENTHPAFVWSLRRTVSSCRIAILHLPDNYNRRIGLQTSVGGARMHCMHA